jgi:diacylglycerol O-acyltransferase / wax synthase
MGAHLTPLDATFLELEQADESAHMHTGAIMVFEPGDDGSAPTREQLSRHLQRRLGQLPRYGQRLSTPHTGGLTWPEWEEDPDFSVARHVGRAGLPAPGGAEELCEWASGFFSQRLDRHRPLWEMVIVEGLAGGRWALATKTHHCMVDGVGSVDVGHLLLDATPDAPSEGAPTRPPGERVASSGDPGGALARLARAWEGLVPADSIVHAARMGIHGIRHPREALDSARATLEVLIREEIQGAPSTSFNVPMGTLRRFEVVSVPLAELKEIRSALGGKLNDVVLTVTASGLRALLDARGETLPSRGLRAMVPVNVRLASEHLALGNKVSSLFVELPVADAELLVRHRATVDRSASLKSEGRQAAGTSAVIELAGLAPPVLHATLAQALYAKRLFNLTITNVPGPQRTLYCFGAPLREIHPLVPLAAEHALGVAVVSYDGNVFFGVVADPDVVPDLDVMIDAMRSSVGELLAAARSTVSV